MVAIKFNNISEAKFYFNYNGLKMPDGFKKSYSYDIKTKSFIHTKNYTPFDEWILTIDLEDLKYESYA